MCPHAPRVLAYHAVFTTYGTWLPNDPRGSWSAAVYSQALRELGEVTGPGPAPTSPSRRQLIEFRRHALGKLQHSPVTLTGEQIACVGRGFGEAVDRLKWTVWACAILPDHVHVVVRRDQHRIEYVVNQLKGAATRAMKWTRPISPWTRGCWKVFLFDEAAIEAAIRYVSANAARLGATHRDRPFVTPF